MLLHAICGAEHVTPQTPPEQTWPVVHALPHMPQLLALVPVLVQLPPQQA
jgi:hypothetical protein